MNTSVELKDVSLSYDFCSDSSIFSRKRTKSKEVAVLNDINLNLVDGDRVAVLGRNGAGKTTLLKIVSGILPITRGEISVTGEVSSILNLSSGIVPKATCMENATLRGYKLGLSGEKNTAYVNGVMERSKLGDHFNRLYQTLSSGMQSRFVVSLFSVTKPDILVMDEWVGVADDNQFDKKGAVSAAVEESKIFLLATHRMKIVRHYCDQAIILDSGRIKFRGDVETAIKIFRS